MKNLEELPKEVAVKVKEKEEVKKNKEELPEEEVKKTNEEEPKEKIQKEEA